MKTSTLKVLITGGAGFIGSNLVEYFLNKSYKVVCLDNFATGFKKNIDHLLDNELFTLIEGDIRNIADCNKAVAGCDYVLHQAALGSVPRSILDPITTNEVNISGFLNMITASRDAGVKRFVYAASSSTYGDSEILPKVEENIGKPLSPYAVTKYVNELYADVFSRTYKMECVGLRYFNVFGKRQDPGGAYAAVIPLWAKQLIEHQSPIINGDGSYSRDFTYIDNVMLANELALSTKSEQVFKNTEVKSEVFNIAFGGNTTLIQLFKALREGLSKYDTEIAKIEPIFGANRIGDIPHSQASIEKAKQKLGYKPTLSAVEGFRKACEWYFNNSK
ncbi:MAG: SDR family oxidoreductase [Bacteroidales bacterium]|nr:SDR family oxidoreductase [Bacteroidales bacterium]